jgi:hypothetical protein
MSVRLMSMVFEASCITSTQKLVLLALADHAADDGTSIYPSVETLANKTCLSNAAVRKALKELRGPVGVIRIARRFTSRMPNKYAINVAQLASFKRVPFGSTQESGVSPDSTLTITKKHPRLSPRSTDPSLTINEPSKDFPLSASSFKTRDIQTAYESCVPYKIDWVKGEGSSAKWLAEAGYSPSDIQQCYATLKAQPFWKDKPLSLTSIKKQIGEWKSNVKVTEKELVFS